MKFAAAVIVHISLLIFFSSCDTNSGMDTNNDIRLLDLAFEDGTHSPWEGQYNEGNFIVETDADPSRNKCGTFILNEGGDYWTSPNTGLDTARSEIQLFDTCKIESTMNYSFDFKIAEDYVESDDWQIFCQFHDQPDFENGEDWSTYPHHSPPIAVKYKNGYLVLGVYSWDQENVMDIASAALAKGVWNRLVLRIRWAMTEAGELRAWLNDEPVKSADNQTVYCGRNCFNQACNYIKIGIYRSNSILTYGKVSFDNIRSYFE